MKQHIDSIAFSSTSEGMFDRLLVAALVDSGCSDANQKKLLEIWNRMTGFVWLPLAGGESSWLCRKCAESLLGLLQQIRELMGEMDIYPPTAQAILEGYLKKPKKVTKG